MTSSKITLSKKYLSYFAIGTLLIYFVATNVANAQTASQRGLTLTPLRSELNIPPGTSLDGELTVTNSTDKPMEVTLGIEEFHVINQAYDYAFTAESDVTKWITFKPAELFLLKGESGKVSFTVGVPLSAEPGGRYMSIFASTDTGAEASGVNSRQRIASLLYITVLGEVTRSGHLVSLTSPWLITGKSAWSAALQNSGTTHFRSRYDVRIEDLFGNVVSSQSQDALILPGTVRKITDDLPLPKFPGVYRVFYKLGLGDTPAKNEMRLIVYLPTTTIFIALLIIIGLGLYMRQRKKH